VGSGIDVALDDYRVYNRALRADEVWRIYNLGATTKIGKARTPAVTTSLIGYWTLDGADINWTTGRVADKSGNGNHGYVQGLMSTSTAPTRGKIGQALNFDGVDDFTRVSSIDLSGTSAVSVSFWMKKASYANLDLLAFENSDNYNNSQTGFMMNTDDSAAGGCLGYLAVYLKGDIGQAGGCFNRPSTGVWHHYVAIYDKSRSSNETDLYVDGVFQTAVSRPDNSNNTNSFGNNPFFFSSRAGQSLFNNAMLDDFRIYKRVLRADEVLKLYEMGR
jgi:hypothetical protein